MKEYITEDGSITLYNPEYEEYYHSKSGALEESFEKFVKPCEIKELAKKGHIKILDIGFGLGYNAIAAIDTALKANNNCEIEIISLENDKSVLLKLKSLKPKLKHYGIIEKLEYDPITKSYLYEDKKIHLRIKIGDATQIIKTINDKFDAVFLDPFSPAKNPELWTVEFFKDIKQRMKQGTILATYSYAKTIRNNLAKAGFTVKDGPIIGRRSPSTIAVIKSNY